MPLTWAATVGCGVGGVVWVLGLLGGSALGLGLGLGLGLRSEEHTSELQSLTNLVLLHSFPTRRSSDLLLPQPSPFVRIVAGTRHGRILSTSGFCDMDAADMGRDCGVWRWGRGLGARAFGGLGLGARLGARLGAQIGRAHV